MEKHLGRQRIQKSVIFEQVYCPTVVEYVFSADATSQVQTQDPPPRHDWHMMISIMIRHDWQDI